MFLQQATTKAATKTAGVESTARTPNDVPHRKWRYDVLAVVARVVVETCRVLLDADRALVAMVCAAAVTSRQLRPWLLSHTKGNNEAI